MSIIEEKETRDRLLASVKKEVKQLMEEAVTKKFVHEDSSCLTSLCATIETCLLHGLKRRSVGLFKTSTTMALLEKISKNFEPAQLVVKLCNDYDDKYCNQNLISKKFFNNQTIYDKDSSLRGRNFAPTFYKGSNCYKFLWIRLALLNKMLNKIIDHIISNAETFYAPYALIADPVDGPIFSSLLVGPCALEYTKLKTCDHLWSDPNADELIQRYRMHNLGQSTSQSATNNGNGVTVPTSSNTGNGSHNLTANTSNASSSFHYQLQSPKLKLGLNASIILKRNASTSNNISVEDVNNNSLSSPTPIVTTLAPANGVNIMKTPMTPASLNSTTCSNSPSSLNSTTPLNNPKEYVESLHQNSKSQLLYGKNYVVVYPKEEMDGLPGYLSLHLNPNGSLALKWTPNQLMNGSVDEGNQTKSKSVYWDYAINVDMNNIVYLHCHQHPTRGATIALVGQDGVQYPPICFPKGSHLLQFLTCLETGLSPGGLDPALWNEEGKGKVLPKLKKTLNGTPLLQTAKKKDANNNDLQEDDYEPKDFVFRISTSYEGLHMNTNTSPNNNIFRNFFNTNNPISSIFSSLSSSSTTPLPASNVDVNSSTTVIQHKFTNSSTSSTESAYCPPTPPTSARSNSSVSSMQSSAIIGSKELKHQVTPSSILNDATRPKLVKSVSVRSSMKLLCDTMKRQIVSRAFYGWLAYCRHLKTIRLHLVGLVQPINEDDDGDEENENEDEFKDVQLITNDLWSKWLQDELENGVSLKKYEKLIYKVVYANGLKTNDLRVKLWPFILKHYTFDMTPEQRFEKDVETKTNYSNLILEWKLFEDFIRLRDQNHRSIILSSASSSILPPTATAAQPPTPSSSLDINNNITSTCIIEDKEKAVAAALIDRDLNLTPITVATSANPKLGQISKDSNISRNDLILLRKDSSLSNDVFIDDVNAKEQQPFNDIPEETMSQSQSKATIVAPSSRHSSGTCSFVSFEDDANNPAALELDVSLQQAEEGDVDIDIEEEEEQEQEQQQQSTVIDDSVCDTSDTSVFTNSTPTTVNNNNNNSDTKNLNNKELLENFATNIHRIDKDVTRCDRNYHYFTSNENLQKLRNIMYTYVWENLHVGYIQGMCDLVAPLLVIFNDEAMAYSCFKQLMLRMAANFPHGSAMDKHFANMRALIQILDSSLFEHMHQRGDYTHFYFSYRWFLLDFKRELLYDDVFTVWETIWSAHYVCSEHFSLFIALALVEAYRDIIIDNNMDFTDIIKFFNEMAEKHNTQHILNLARESVKQLQELISNKDEF